MRGEAVFGVCGIEMSSQEFVGRNVRGGNGVDEAGAVEIMDVRFGNFRNILGRRHFKTSTLAALLTSLAVLSIATPRMRGQTGDAAASSALKAEMQPLAFFLGEWNCEGEFIASKKPTAAHISTTPDLDGAWVAFRWTDQAPSQFHALELFGYDKGAKHFTNFIHDNFGGVRLFNSPGWEADTFTWTGNALAASAAQSERFVIERKSAKEFVITWETRKVGADWNAGDRLTCKR
jgi:hypothetical protein